MHKMAAMSPMKKPSLCVLLRKNNGTTSQLPTNTPSAKAKPTLSMIYLPFRQCNVQLQQYQYTTNIYLCQAKKSQKDSYNKVTILSETRSTWGSAPRCAFTPLFLHLTMNRGSGRVTPSIWFGARLAPLPYC